MKAEKKSFVMSFDWYPSIQECTDEEKAWILDSVYRYQLYGEVPKTNDRFLKMIFAEMRKFFDYNAVKYEEQKIQNSLNQRKRWAKTEEEAEAIEEEKRFLKSHSIEEYTAVYGRIQTNTDNDIGNDTDNEIGTDSDIDNENDTDIGCDYGSGDVSKGREQVTLQELQDYHSKHGYTFDCRKAYSAKINPLYWDELKTQCDMWEELSKR